MTDRVAPGRKLAAEDVLLRPVEAADVPLFFAHANDAEALRVAALLPEGPGDWAAFRARWTRWFAHAGTLVRTVVCEGNVVGYLISFPRLGRREVGGWFARASWGRGIATQALRAFLAVERSRPLHARVAAANAGAARVLERCGFAREVVSRAKARDRDASVGGSSFALS